VVLGSIEMVITGTEIFMKNYFLLSTRWGEDHKINTFLDNACLPELMVQAVDPSLYREKILAY